MPRQQYVCKYCQVSDPNQFTKKWLYECRKCRAKKSQDRHFEKFAELLYQQELVNRHWRIACSSLENEPEQT